MTEDIKVTRLSKAAREFNVGISTIVDFLHKKGFDLDPNPNTKIPQEAFLLLVKEYSTDISAKKESEKLAIKDLHRKKEALSIDDVSEKPETEEPEKDDEILVKDSSGSTKSIDLKAEIKIVGKIDLDKTVKTKPAPSSLEPEKKTVKKPAEPEKESKKVVSVPKMPEAAEEPEKAGVDIRIVGKIDLGAIEVETKDSKKEKKADKEIIPEKPAAETPKTHVIEEPSDILASDEELIEDIIDDIITPEQEEKISEVFRPNYERLSGPTVVGRIDLAVEEKKKPAPYQPVKVNGD